MRVILIRLSALGDIVHTWPLAVAFRELAPDSHLSWVVDEPLRTLVAGHPAIDAVFTTTFRRWRRRPLASRTRAEIAATRSALQELQPDVTIDAQGTVKSSLVTRWTGAQWRVGLARPWRRERIAGLAYNSTVAGAPVGSHIVETNLHLVRALGFEPPALQAPDGSWLLDRTRSRLPSGSWGSRFGVLLPGAGRPDKTIPVDTLVEVGRGFHELGLDVVVVWGPGEADRAQTVTIAGGDRFYIAPPTDLEGLTALLGAASVVVGGDTGPVHLAASLGTRTVGVHLVTDVQRNGPLGVRAIAVSGASAAADRPSGSARVRPQRSVRAPEILDAVRQTGVRSDAGS